MNDQQKALMANVDQMILKELNKSSWDWERSEAKVVKLILSEPSGEIREYLLGRAVHSRIQDLATKKRKEAQEQYEAYRPTDADKAAFASVAERVRGAVLQSLWNFPLPGGNLLKSATRGEVLVAVTHYKRVVTRAENTQKTGQIKVTWLTFVAQELDSSTKVVAEQLTPEEVLEARDRAEELV